MSGGRAELRRRGEKKRLSTRWRAAISLLLLVHLAAVFFPPFTFATAWTGMASPFADPIMRGLRPYVSFLFLDHGYFFFAPNPGPSHLLKARLEFADGRPPQELLFPDREQQWPRLLYHRHFMLAEQLHADFTPPQPPPGAAEDVEQMNGWRRARDMYEARRRSFEDHLRHAYGASQVTLTRLEHAMPGPGEFQELRKALQAEDSYRELPETVLDVPLLPPPSLVP